MDKVRILHDLRKVANAMKMISLQTRGDEKLKTEILLLSQHLDILYKDIEPNFKGERRRSMIIKKVFQKGALGILTFAVSYLATHPQTIVKLIPEEIMQMTVGSLVAGAVVALNNYLKHRKEK